MVRPRRISRLWRRVKRFLLRAIALSGAGSRGLLIAGASPLLLVAAWAEVCYRLRLGWFIRARVVIPLMALTSAVSVRVMMSVIVRTAGVLRGIIRSGRMIIGIEWVGATIVVVARSRGSGWFVRPRG